MIRYLTFSLTLSMSLGTLAIPLRAAKKPRAGTDNQRQLVWTNDDLARLHSLGLISIVGQSDQAKSTSASVPEAYVKTQDPEWYAQEAARLRNELQGRQAQLSGFCQAIKDVRSLKTVTGGINLDDSDIGITPEENIKFLQQRANETQTELDALEDLARRNDIEPGTLRGQ